MSSRAPFGRAPHAQPRAWPPRADGLALPSTAEPAVEPGLRGGRLFGRPPIRRRHEAADRVRAGRVAQ